ncbi:PIN domain-containing protein [Salinarimonas sp.]|uniref:PIN domain-containing protein n=1 Tax=Salinarimonas sp. TaxID=2766526 RepID=UPI0032D98E04
MSVEAGSVYRDSNAFIAAFETRGGHANAMRSLFTGATPGVIRRVTSELTLAEVLAKPARLDDAELTDAYLTLIVRSGLRVRQQRPTHPAAHRHAAHRPDRRGRPRVPRDTMIETS